eukprot:1000379_1
MHALSLNYSSYHKIFIFAESSDFSLTKALIAKCGRSEHILTTRHASDAVSNIESSTVTANVDITNLQESIPLSHLGTFNLMVATFPRISTTISRSHYMNANQNFMKQILHTAHKWLSVHGELHLVILRKQYSDWNI